MSTTTSKSVVNTCSGLKSSGTPTTKAARARNFDFTKKQSYENLLVSGSSQAAATESELRMNGWGNLEGLFIIQILRQLISFFRKLGKT